MIAEASCRDCVYVERIARPEEEYTCHRRAPRPRYGDPVVEAERPIGIAVWPLVDADDWCGEFHSISAGGRRRKP